MRCDVAQYQATFSVRLFLTRCRVLPLIMLFCVGAAAAQSASLDPVVMYEGSLRSFNLTASNLGGSSVITSVAVDLPGFSSLSASDYLGWDETVLGSTLLWNNGSLENNIAWALFGFSARAPVVSGNTSVNVTATLGSSLITIPLTLVDDPSAPTLSSPNPVDGSVIGAGITNYGVSIGAADPESEVASVTFGHALCTLNQTILTLADNAGSWNSSVDMSSYNESVTVCFTFTSSNYAGLTSTYSGQLLVDATPPQVLAVSPVSGASSGVLTNFTFNASDNLAQTLSCDVFVDNASVVSGVVSSGDISTLSASLAGFSDGAHTWTLSCADGVGLVSRVTSSFVLDATPPTITLNSPVSGSYFIDTNIDYDVSDNVGVASVTSNLPSNTSSWTEGPNTFTVTATDLAGNTQISSFSFTVDRSAPSVTLLSPLPGTQSDSPVNFTYSAGDLLSPSLACLLSTAVGVNVSQSPVANSSISSLLTLTLGNTTWQVSCTDLAGNIGSAGPQAIEVKDLSGPQISTSFNTAQRTYPNTITANITDVSGVDTAVVHFENSTLVMNLSAGVYTSELLVDSSHTLGNYTLVIEANDSNGFLSTLAVPFTLVAGHNITLAMNSVFVPDQTVPFTVLVERDDNGNLSGMNLTLNSSGVYSSVGVLNDSNGFGDTFVAPSTTGTYTLTSSYEADGFVYRAVHSYVVENPGSPSGSDSFSGSHGGGRGDSNIQSSPRASGTDTPNTDSSPTDSPNVNGADDASPLIDEDPAAPQDQRQALGQGEATGLLSLDRLKPLWWVLLLLAAVIIGLLIMSRARKTMSMPPPPKNGEINWDELERKD